MMRSTRRLGAFVILLLPLASTAAPAQGSLQDYQRAERFLPGNVRHLVFVADVNPHWIEKTNRFWYRRVGLSDTQFILVDAEKNTSEPAFDHERLATALSHAAKQEYSASALPFFEFKFVDDGKAIRFSVESAQWTCTLAAYECTKDSTRPEKPNEVLSPNKRWAALVKEHNLYLRDVSTGTSLQLTHDGVAGWDYATPLPSLRVMVDQVRRGIGYVSRLLSSSGKEEDFPQFDARTETPRRRRTHPSTAGEATVRWTSKDRRMHGNLRRSW